MGTTAQCEECITYLIMSIAMTNDCIYINQSFGYSTIWHKCPGALQYNYELPTKFDSAAKMSIRGQGYFACSQCNDTFEHY